MNEIGSLNEQPLHASLKEWYAGADGRVEVLIDGFIVDVFKDGSIIEIQTGNFSSIKSKLTRLSSDYNLKLVYPVAAEKWILKHPKDNMGEITKRKSPKKGRRAEIFTELVSFPELLCSERFSLEITMIKEQELRVFTGEKPWRQHGWVTVERQLLEVMETHTYHNPSELSALIPSGLPKYFTTNDIASTGSMPRWLAQKMAYCLRNMGVIEQVGKKGRSNLYALI
jgi:hypothetical protein